PGDIKDSCILIPCTFSYPSTVTSTGIVAIWYKDYDNERIVIYHSATPSEVDGRFQGRTELLGNLASHNCTLLLRGVRSEDSGKYNFRFEINQGDRPSPCSFIYPHGLPLTTTCPLGPPALADSYVMPHNVPKETHLSLLCSSPVAQSLNPVFSLPHSAARMIATPAPEVQEGQGVNLTCHVSSNSSAMTKYSWYRNGQWLSEGLANSLVFQRVATARVLITPSTDVQEGDDVSLTCDVTGNAPEDATYTWYKNSHRLQESSDSFLAFPHITSGDTGSYHCKAHNPEGTSSSISPFLWRSVDSVSLMSVDSGADRCIALLLNYALGWVYCFSPEPLLEGGYSRSWLEIFQREIFPAGNADSSKAKRFAEMHRLW
uniref:Sialic acid binding Ig like lectin 1 n=1 Tax=Chelonoidis abingdonii TaxID=106734 RepID=A0A8C0GDF8_CHEAB